MKKTFDRRNFLKLAGLGSVAVVGTALASPLNTLKFDQTLYRTSSTRLMMGTFVNITVFHSSRDQAEEAVGRAFELIACKENILTRFQESSPVGALNKEGVLKELEPEVNENLRLAFHFHRLSGGAFDITVKPLIDVIRQSFMTRNSPPDPVQLEKALDLVGMEHLSFSSRRVTFDRQGMGITLDGIAKGYIADQTVQLLRAKGIRHVLVNAGGDIRVMGGRSQGRPWRIAIRDPQNRNKYASVVRMMNGAVATSGNYEIYFDREKTFHHIVDPKSGRSPLADQSVTTVTQVAVKADALSTAVFVMKPSQGVTFLQGLPGVEGLIITRKGRKLSTPGWIKLTV